jgi:hypothetical protein
MIGAKFDTRDLKELETHFHLAAAGMREKVLSRSVNKIAGKANTLAKRSIAKAGGFKIRYVADRLSLQRASASSPNPTAEITAAGRYTTLAQFSPSPRFVSGGKFKRAKPWGERQRYKRAFWIEGRHGNAVPVTRTGKGKHKYKTLYGPSAGRELGRPDSLNPVQDMITRDLPLEIKRYAAFELGKYKTRMSR